MKTWILGREYDFANGKDRQAALDLITKRRGMPNDLQHIGFKLMEVIILMAMEKEEA